YLVVDECSMVVLDTLALLSRIVQEVKGRHEKVALYRQTIPNMLWTQIGQNIFSQFNTAIILRQQMRMRTDPEWGALLEHPRVGACSANNIRQLHNLNQRRHGVQAKWNSAALHKHCCLNGKILFVSPAEDTIGMPGQQLMQYKNMKVGQKSKLRLAPIVELAKGMRAVIMLNLSVSADITNGTLGTIEKIFLDPREPPITSRESVVKLKYPPALLISNQTALAIFHFQIHPKALFQFQHWKLELR
ncbi:hypothetical protein M422DRAFT_185243, partial [Sphaerobolus stellatus SS14]